MREASVERLCRRLAETPAAFLRPVMAGKKGDVVHVEAVIADLFRARSTRTPAVSELEIFQRPTDRNKKARRRKARHLELALVASWLLADEAFGRLPDTRLLELFRNGLEDLSGLVMPRAFLEDPDRREELVRVCLRKFKILPMGETRADADDRLETLDSIRRDRLMRRAREREQEREAERERRRQELEAIRKKEEEERRKAARSTFED